MSNVRTLIREDGRGDCYDPEPQMFEQDTGLRSGVKLCSLGEVIYVVPFTDMPSYAPSFSIERRMAGRFLMSRTTARQMYKELGATPATEHTPIGGT